MATAASRARRVRRRPEVARGEILEAAAPEFAEHGFEGARLEKIAARAEINVSLIYHYFANKEDLFIAVLEEAYARMRDYAQDTAIRARDPVTAMVEFVRARFRIFLERPELVGLLNAENVHKAVHIAKSEKIAGLYGPLIAELDALLARGAAAGVFRPGIDATELFITINAIGYFYLSNRYTLGVVLSTDLTAPDRVARRESHIVEVVLAVLRPEPATPDASPRA